MFVPVSCTSCGKPFQVPEAALGQLAPCPWCRATVLALPVAAPLPQSDPPAPRAAATAPPAAPEPLSLDDDEPTPVTNTPPEAPPKPKRPPWAALAVAVVILIGGAAATVLIRNYGSGRLVASGWSEFTPPDGSFTVALPETPTETPVEANPAGSLLGGKRYSAHGWYSKTNVWIAYNDLDPSLAPKLVADRDHVLAAGVLGAEREREKARLGGTVTTEAPFRLGDWWGVELHLDTPHGKAVEWLIFVGTRAHPRVYVYGAEGKDLTPESPVCRRLNGTFRLND